MKGSISCRINRSLKVLHLRKIRSQVIYLRERSREGIKIRSLLQIVIVSGCQLLSEIPTLTKQTEEATFLKGKRGSQKRPRAVMAPSLTIKMTTQRSKTIIQFQMCTMPLPGVVWSHQLWLPLSNCLSRHQSLVMR